MSPLPLPIRVAAGLAAIALERARQLPRDPTEWPMSAVSQALQVSMRVQQRITELAIKGDEALAGLREPEEDPPWAVFDEDLPQPSYLRQPAAGPAGEPDLDLDAFDDEYAASVAPAETMGSMGDPADPAGPVVPAGTANSGVRNGGHAGGTGPGALPNYGELSLASVRARLRVLSLTDLEELLAYERSHDDRPEFVRMLTNRIATVRDL